MENSDDFPHAGQGASFTFTVLRLFGAFGMVRMISISDFRDSASWRTVYLAFRSQSRGSTCMPRVGIVRLRKSTLAGTGT